MERFALIGNPIQHSLSPRIHQLLFRIRHKDVSYTLLEADNLDQSMAMVKKGINGFNITIPYKEAVVDFLAAQDPFALRCGAVNTVRVNEQDGGLVGYNTDGPGFIRGLKYRGVVVLGFRVLVLGAGGAARSIACALMDEGAAEVQLYNRNGARAKTLAKALGAPVVALDDQPVDQHYDLIINTTPLGSRAKPQGLPLDLCKQGITCTYLVDCLYLPLETPLMAMAKTQGAARVMGGLDMLFFQALLAQEIWHGPFEPSHDGQIEAALLEVESYVARGQ